MERRWRKPNPPVNIDSGDPAGTYDNYLLNESRGGGAQEVKW